MGRRAVALRAAGARSTFGAAAACAGTKPANPTAPTVTAAPVRKLRRDWPDLSSDMWVPFQWVDATKDPLGKRIAKSTLNRGQCFNVAKNGGISTPFSGSGTFDIGHWLRLSVMEPKDTPAKTPRAIVLIHALAYLGIALWLAIFLMAALGSFTSNKWVIMALAIGLGLLHFAISRLTAKRSRAAIALIWVLLVADLGLMFFVTWRAAILVIASVILVILEIRTLKPTANTPH